MRTYTEEEVRKAFIAGRDYSDQVSDMDEDEFIESLSPKQQEEKTIPFTYASIKAKIDWEDFCDITGIDYYAKRNGCVIEDYEVFRIPESKAKEHGLIP